MEEMRMKKVLVLLMVLALPCVASAWDAAADFSTTNGNPNGVWSYGYYDRTTGSNAWIPYNAPGAHADILINWTLNGDPDTHGNVNKNITANTFTSPGWVPGMSWRPGQLCVMSPYFFGSNDDDPAVRFTVPATGSYEISANWENRAMDGSPTDVFVLVNGTIHHFDQISGFTEFDPPLAESVSIYAATLPLKAGDILDFGVSDVVNNGGHQVGLSVMIVPEPITIALMGLGSLSLLRRRR
jgi:hypothetical protein